MRKLYLLVAMAFLFQSCFSYKAMDNDTSKLKPGKTYKIEQNHKHFKVIFHEVKGNNILVTKDFEKKEIPINEITDIKKRKFSIAETFLWPTTMVAGLVGLFVLTY